MMHFRRYRTDTFMQSADYNPTGALAHQILQTYHMAPY